MTSIICRVPNGLPQRTQSKGSASFRTTSCLASAASSSRGPRARASSGQVVTQSPHCTQLRSMNLSIGVSRPSTRAEAGQAPTQAMQSVQVCRFTVTAP